jgi:hypothetical protein
METYDLVIGIDPGVNGGIALWQKGAALNPLVWRMPRDVKELGKLLDWVKEISKHPIVFLEKVNLRHDDVADPGKAFRVQKLLADHQRLKDVIEFHGVTYVLVHPMSWMSYLHLRKPGEEKKERKNRLKEAAQFYYPRIKATLWNADAMLIMHFGRLKLRDDMEWVQNNIPREIKEQEADKLF